MRVAHLDMTDPTHHCPTRFRKIETPIRTCGRPGSGCYATTYPVDGIAYSRVCGKIKAYQQYSPDAFHPYSSNRARTIDDQYVDGVSLTHGQNPRKHIWTFANALDEVRSAANVCPCTKTDTPYTGVVPHFVGNDYFCDTGEAVTLLQTSSTARTHYGMELDVGVPAPAVSSIILPGFVSSCHSQSLMISS